MVRKGRIETGPREDRPLRHQTNLAFEIGSSRTRFPVAAQIAVASAGTIGGNPGSPTPPGGASLSTMWTST